MNANTATAPAVAGLDTRLTFCHPNAKNSGFAIQFSVHPATPDREGRVAFSIAKQITLESPGVAAIFDWAGKMTVKLDFIETSELLMVLGGAASVLTHAGKDALFHNTPAARTSIAFKRSEDPCRPGFLLGVGRTPKADPTARQYFTFYFSPAEAFGLRLALQEKMGELAFGV